MKYTTATRALTGGIFKILTLPEILPAYFVGRQTVWPIYQQLRIWFNKISWQYLNFLEMI